MPVIRIERSDTETRGRGNGRTMPARHLPFVPWPARLFAARVLIAVAEWLTAVARALVLLRPPRQGPGER